MSNRLPPDTDWLLLTRAADGELTPADERALARWMAVDPAHHQALLDSVKAIRQRSAYPLTVLDSRASLAQARARLGLDATPSRATVRAAPSRRPRWVEGVLLSACVLMGLFVVRGHVGLPGTRDYATPSGTQLRITLVDGTSVTLGPDSRLRVPRDYGAPERRLALEGEAYFAVVHDATHPLVIRANDIEARDIGTAFDVRAYSGEETSVAVAEGKVAVTGAGTDRLLGQGDVATVDREGMHMLHLADLSSYTGWMQGRLVFTKVPLADVVRDLSRTFDLSIAVGDSTLARQRITAAFDHETAEQVLEDLADIVGGSYQRTGRTVVIRRGGVKTQDHNERPATPLLTAQTRELHE